MKGYSVPLSPKGRASLVAPPPWHYVGSVLVVDYWAEAEACAAHLPPGLSPSPAAAGRCRLHVCEWQSATDGGEELLDPVRAQYREAFVLVEAGYEGEAVQFCPYIYVDQDISLLRGIIQGLPKKLASIWLTRSYGVDSPAAPALGRGGAFAGTLTVKDRRIAEAVVRLEEEAPSPAPGLTGGLPILGLRHFPEIAPDRHDRPAVHELVRFGATDLRRSAVWKGSAGLELFASPTEEIADLRPVRIEAGYRYDLAFTVPGATTLRDLRAR
jgi:hypothetical protein